MLKKIAKYIQEQNEKIYAPRGLVIVDPIERGLRVVSFGFIGLLLLFIRRSVSLNAVYITT